MTRREVIESYSRYDFHKKHPDLPLPDLKEWDWSSADAIDDQMCRSNLKMGVPAGYELWDEVLLSLDDLRQCAVHNVINEGLGTRMRMLGDLDARGLLEGWLPPAERAWHLDIATGKVPDEGGPLLLRPAVWGEFPAKWYVEDGSGQATAFVKYRSRFNPSAVLAKGFLGTMIDPRSKFMREHFQKLCIYRL
ncbi:MAG: hypothetical protein ACLQMO_03250 [Acidobacteriaceae bacterium]